MTLLPGTRIGNYEIVAPIGAGGMGEVYRARDPKLGREVAIKVLPTAVAQDSERLARFEREARILAALNHSNIAHVYGFEGVALADGASAHFLAMELVEGEDLAERLKRGPIPADEAAAIARQIAEGLEEAHERGIIHRDLKPANIKVSTDGRVKVLDFGLAKALEEVSATSAANSQLSHSPTLSRNMTEAGMIMGTAAYMSPEQARGKAVDKRADIWAFGVVFYEMLTGTRLFAGETVSDTLAAVLRQEPDWSLVPKEVSPVHRRLLKRCLERDPRKRLRDIGEARLALSDESDASEAESGAPAMAPTISLGRRAAPWAMGFALGALVTGSLDRTILSPTPPDPPRLVSLTYSGSDSSPTASADGRMVAFMSKRDGRSRIWLKQIATGEEVAITDGPSDSGPIFSPDGSSLLFVRGAAPPWSLFKVAAVGGTARRIADNVASSPTWSPDGERVAIVRASTPGGVPDTLITLARDGGDERELARVTEVALGNPKWRPDGAAVGVQTFLTTNGVAGVSVVEFDINPGASRTLYEQGPASILGAWSWNGAKALLVTETANQSGRGGAGGLRRVEIGRGPPTTLMSLQTPALGLDIAGPGRVVLDALSPTQNLFLRPVTPNQGNGTTATLTRGDSVDRQPVISPDGTRVAFTSDREGNVDIWELDLASGGLRRLTTDPADDWDPAYTPDGSQLLWSSNRGGHYEVWMAAMDGSGARQITADGVDAENPTMTADGRWITYASANPAQNGIWKIRPDGTEATLLVKGAMSNPEVSPDGAWVAFVDTASSRVGVVTVDNGTKVAALDLPSTFAAGGVLGLTVGRARWIPKSRTLAWVDYDIKLRATRLVSQDIAPGQDTGPSRRLLAAGTFDEMPESFGFSPDGREVLISSIRDRSNILMIDGLPGVTR